MPGGICLERSISRNPATPPSRYAAGLQCLRRLWLDVHTPGDWSPPEPGSAEDIGVEIGRKQINVLQRTTVALVTREMAAPWLTHFHFPPATFGRGFRQEVRRAHASL